MPKGNMANHWLRHVAVACIYALAYVSLQHISFSHFALIAGFRLSVWLLVPYRYWLALLIGEAGSLAYTSIECADLYGWLWGGFFMVPPALFSMPVIRWFRERRRLFSARATANINVFLLCTLVVSVIWAAVNLATLLLMRLPPGVTIQPGVASRYFMGNYLGILTIVPVVLLVREELHAHGLHRFWVRLSESRLAMEATCLLLPSLALLVWLASGGGGAASEEARVAMFLPVAWLALRHGWRGAAVGGSAASLAVVLAMPFHRDSGTLHAQVFVAFTITTMLMLGGQIAVLDSREKREKSDARLMLAVAQRNVYLGELQLRQTSFALEQLNGVVQASYTQLLGRLRCLLPGFDDRSYYRQAAVTQHQMYRLADSLHPLAWAEGGLQAALREGSLPRALDEAGIVYWCGIREPGLCKLSTSVHMALYRLAVEAVALACAKHNISHLHVQLRAGEFGERCWAVLCVESRVEYGQLSRIRWEDLPPALGGSGLGLGAIKDRAMVFGGKVRVRPTLQGQRISLMLFEPVIN